MMGASFLSELTKTDFRHHSAEARRFVRFEYGESDPTWIIREVDEVTDEYPVRNPGPFRRFGFSLRAFAAKVAGLLL